MFRNLVWKYRPNFVAVADARASAAIGEYFNQPFTTDAKPAESSTRVISSYGKKGEVEGANRIDQVTITVLTSDGLHVGKPQTVKKPLVDPHAGMTPDELMDAILLPKLR
jgi:hypothetical protein